MAANPLSTATRTTKQNLLAVASVVILVKVFDVSVERSPSAGWP
ncbi:hypothetical protein [Azospirillum oryzae]|nr:hypothetical protein [Azospirillum oryzae]